MIRFCKLSLILTVAFASQLHAGDYNTMDHEEEHRTVYNDRCHPFYFAVAIITAIPITIMLLLASNHNDPDRDINPGDPCYKITAQLGNHSYTLEPACTLWNYKYPPSECYPPIALSAKEIPCANFTKCYSNSAGDNVLSMKCYGLTHPQIHQEKHETKLLPESISNTTKQTLDDFRTRFKMRKKQLREKRISKK
jgi:hypothetical protein